MGAKASKLEGGSYLPDTPTLNKLRLPNQLQTQEQVELTPTRRDENCLDPRSPNGCRTPLNFLQNPKEKNAVAQQVKSDPEQGQDEESNENAFAQFKKRLLKGFSLNDPRSPQLNRTPLILDEVRSLNLDDTFADLFVDTRAGAATVKIASETAASTTPPSSPPSSSGDDEFGTPLSHNNSSVEIVSLPYDAEETMPCDVKLQKTPPAIHIHHNDPRSPSLNVERTPIIFCDDEDDEAHEAQMLEQILETLTLNLSQESSIMEMPQQSMGEMPQSTSSQQLPANKHLERVRLGNKRRVAPRKPARATKTQIYVDKESATPSKANNITPNSGPATPLSGQKRTPLSCVKNRQHLPPSQTVEKDVRKTPFNDQLNPSRILIAGEDSLDGFNY
ncbi:uncharacterized protein msb1l [Drosophila tropicalis]|uniref:uncharacterized protein msb1l n=1 Tax=Drosophila tropicalis TaxID=46794 RepID=UPI0035ABAD74